MRPSSVLAVVGVLSLVLVALLLPMTACGCKMASKGAAGLSNVKQQALGMILYTEDNGDRYPSRVAWMDRIKPYVKEERVFHDPEGPKAAYGYAFNAALSGAKSPKAPETVPMVYDSVNPTRNASDLVTSLPKPGRHGSKERPRNTVGYADGHARGVAAP